MNRSVVESKQAPAAVGPYSQAIQAGPFLWASGQIPLDPATGRMVDGGIAEQTERVLENLRAVLEAGGCSLEDVVRVTVYLTSMDDFAAMNDVYARWFRTQPPARVCVEVRALPKGAQIEMDAVALVR